MANNLEYNPLRVDTAGLIWEEKKFIADFYLQSLQWVDDDTASGGNFKSGDNLTMTINGATIRINIPVAENVQPVAYEAVFPVPVKIIKMTVDVIDGGTLIVWRVL